MVPRFVISRVRNTGVTLCIATIIGGVSMSSLADTPPAAAPATTGATLDQRLEAIDSKAGQVLDFTASFRQEKFTALVDEPIISSGMIYSKGAVVLWRATQPQHVETRVTPDRLQMYYADQNLIEDYPIRGNLGTLAASPLPRLDTLREQFDLAQDDGAGLTLPQSSNPLLVVRLSPKQEDVKKYVHHVRVVLDETRGIVVQFEMVDPDEERTLIHFDNVKLNAGVDDAKLKIDAPADVKTVRPLEPGTAR